MWTGETVTVTQTAASGGTKYNARTVNVQDNDAGLVVNPQAVTVVEGTTTGSVYTVALNPAPTGPVTATSGDTAVALDTDASPQTRVLVYSTTNWNTAQAVTATRAANDPDGADAEVSVGHAVASSDARYTHGARAEEQVTVTIADDEAPVIVVSESALAVAEGTSPTAPYTVALGVPPTASVRVHVARSVANYVLNQAGGTQGTTQDLTFSTTTWNTGQVITVIALDDDNALAGTSNIRHTTVDAATAA